MKWRLLWLTFALSSCGFCQDGTIYGPRMGLVYDADAGLRLVMGIPGSAYVGSVLPVEFRSASVVVAPEQSFALAVSFGKLTIIDASRLKTAIRAVEGVTDAARIWFSPGGKSALVIAASGDRAQALTGLPEAPRISGEFAFGVTAEMGAISEDARFVITTSSDGAVSQWDGQGKLLSTASLGAVTALQFYVRGGDALLAGSAGKMLYRIRESGEIVAVRELDSAAALATSANDSVLYVLSSDGSILALRENGEQLGVYTSPVKPTGLQRLGGVLRLNDYSGGPLPIFDGSQILYIPPAKDGGDQ